MSTPVQAMSASDFNLQKLNTKELSQHLGASIEYGGNVFILGLRGIGKTSICKQQIKDSGLREVYINLSLFERTDLAGYPLVFAASQQQEAAKDLKRNFVDFLLPRMFEPLMHGDKEVVILFDEVDKADPSIWAPLLEIVQFKSINGTSLPKLRCCLMTGNLISEGGQRPLLPLLDRAEKYILAAEIGPYLEWSGATGALHTSIFQFLQDNPDRLCTTAQNSENYASQSPRGWVLSSGMAYFGEEHKWSPELILEKVSGFVGKQAGIEYMSYYLHYQKLLPICREVMEGKQPKAIYNALAPGEKNVVSMIIAARFSAALDKHNPETDTPEFITHVGNFMQYAGHENVVSSLRAQVQLTRIMTWKLMKHEAWREIIKTINSYTAVNEVKDKK